MLCPMTPMLTIATLAVITREEIAADDLFALWVIESASLTVADEAKHLDWIAADDPVAAPARATLIAQGLAKRTYLNPDAIVGEGGVGPIGGDRYVEDYARTLELTQVERDILADMAGDGAAGGQSGLWTQSTENIPQPRGDQTIYAPDVDSRANSWPIGQTGVDDYAYTPQV